MKARRATAPQDPGQVFRSETPLTARRESASTATVPKVPHELNILLVEDNVVNAKVLTKQLRKAGCNVELANHGMECLEALQRTKSWKGSSVDGTVDYDCIPMDVEMPIMDGLTATKHVRGYEQSGRLTKHHNIIAITANARDEQIQQAMEAGVDTVQPRPFRVKDLLERIYEIMEQPRT